MFILLLLHSCYFQTFIASGHCCCFEFALPAFHPPPLQFIFFIAARLIFLKFNSAAQFPEAPHCQSSNYLSRHLEICTVYPLPPSLIHCLLCLLLLPHTPTSLFQSISDYSLHLYHYLCYLKWPFPLSVFFIFTLWFFSLFHLKYPVFSLYLQSVSMS